MLDTAYVRSQFPALSDEWALFDNAGGSVPLRGVIDRVRDYMSTCQVQHGATYALSEMAAARVAAGRSAVARLLNADADEIVLGPSSTINVQLLARALQPQLAAGDEVIVTNVDHETNIGPWRALERDGIRIREWAFDPQTLALTLAGLEPLLSARTRLVCFTHCSNITGTIHDAAAIVRRVHEAGALTCIDGVAFAPHRRVDVRALDADFYFISMYKVYGPHIGALFGKRKLLRQAKGQHHYFHAEDDVAHKFEPGNAVHELAASLDGIVAYLLALDLESHSDADASDAERLGRAFGAIAQHEEALAEPLLAFLRQQHGVRIIGDPSSDPRRRVPTISFVVEGHDASELPLELDRESLAVRFGHFYAYRLMEALGLNDRNGVVRVSMVHYNTAAEVERLVAALDALLRVL